MLSFSSLVPSFYQRLLDPDLLALKIIEDKATCSSCREVPNYREDLKCCTFHPFLPNYLVGKILLQEQKHPSFVGDKMAEKIKKREFVLPLGVPAPLKYQFEFYQRKKQDFGKNPDWLCPYYDQQKNHCGIWRHRGSVCTSFYCQSSKGKAGQTFWRAALDYLSYVEMALAEEALVHLDFSPRQVSDLLVYLNQKKAPPGEKPKAALSPALAKKLWNGYFDDQEGFFIKTSEFVDTLSRSQFQETMGDLGQKLTEKFLSAGRIWTH